MGNPAILKMWTQAHALNIGIATLSSTWKGGTETPQTFFGSVRAGVGTIRSARAPAAPRASEISRTVFFPIVFATTPADFLASAREKCD